jgi:molecular chaperone GrpE
VTGNFNGPGSPAARPGYLGTGGGAPSPQPAKGEPEGEPEGVRFRDNRRIDPVTFEARPSTAEPAAAPDTVAEELELDPVAESVAADERVVELTADLQRLSAEYANYRRRVERDRALQAELTTVSLMTELLPILDDLRRAAEHDELSGGFKAVAESVQNFADAAGVEVFGAEGEAFDPNFHEAMTSNVEAGYEEPTVTNVYQVGYRIKDRVLRAARVGVTEAE